MNKIAKTFKALGMLLKNPWLLNTILESDEEWKKYVGKKYNMKYGLPQINAKQLFGDFDVHVKPFAFLGGGSLPTDLALLRKLASLKKNCRYFEIGTWRGESVANVAAEAAECFTLNLSAE